MHARCKRKRLLRYRSSVAQCSILGQAEISTLCMQGARGRGGCGAVSQQHSTGPIEAITELHCVASQPRSKGITGQQRGVSRYCLIVQARSPASGYRLYCSGIVQCLVACSSSVEQERQRKAQCFGLKKATGLQPVSCRPPCRLTAKAPGPSLRCHTPFALHHAGARSAGIDCQGLLAVLTVSGCAALAAGSRGRAPVLPGSPGVCRQQGDALCALLPHAQPSKRCSRRPLQQGVAAGGSPQTVPTERDLVTSSR